MNTTPKEKAKHTSAILSIPPKRLLAKAMAALMLYLGLSPLFLLPGAYLSLELLPVAFLPAAALALTFFAGLVPRKWRKHAFALALCLQAALGITLLLPSSPLALVLLLPCLGAMILFMPAMIRTAGLEWSGQQLSMGAILHVIGQLVKGMPEFASMGSLLTAFFCLYMILCLFMLNRYALMDGTGEKQSPPAKLLAQNRMLVIIISAIALLASSLKALKDAVNFVWDMLLKGIAALVLFIMQLFPAMTPINNTGGGQGMDLGMMGEQQEPGLLSMILEKVLMAVGILLGLALIVFGLYKAQKVLKRAVKALLERFRAYSKSIGEGYVDKTENLFDLGQASKAVLQRWSALANRLKRLPPIDKLPPREKVRRTYALLKRRMPELPDSMTAREMLSSDAFKLTLEQKETISVIYEQARYSSQPISPAQAEDMRKNAGI